MSDFLEKICVQDALYWALNDNDGYEDTFDPPILIKCRWEDVSELILDKNGEKVLSNAKILVLQDLDVGGVLYLGDFSGITNEHRVSPLTLGSSFIIKKFSKIPRIKSTTKFVRTVWL